MIAEIKNLLLEYEIKTITLENCEDVMEVYNTNQDFFMLSSGRAATIEDCRNDINTVPPFSFDEKVFVSLWRDGCCVSVLDIIVGYPKEAYIWIGFLLIHGEWHRKQIGTEIVNAILKAAENKGCVCVQLGVLEDNEKGRKFWEKLGFEKIRESKIEEEGKPEQNIIGVEKQVKIFSTEKT